jgi:hypothetical protein
MLILRTYSFLVNTVVSYKIRAKKKNTHYQINNKLKKLFKFYLRSSRIPSIICVPHPLRKSMV